MDEICFDYDYEELERLEKAEELKEYNEMLDDFILQKYYPSEYTLEYYTDEYTLEIRAERLERNLEDDIAKRKQAFEESRARSGAKPGPFTR